MVGTGAARRCSRPAVVAATLTLLLPALLSALALRWPVLDDALLLDRAGVAQGQWWRLWSGHLLHLDAAHALADLGALAIIALLGLHQRMIGEVIIAMLAGMPVLSMALLWMDPALHWYAGLSGIAHGLLVIVLWRRGGIVACSVLALLAAKLLWEWHAGSPWQGFPVITLAHRLGAAWGVAWLIATWGWRATRSLRVRRL